MTGTIRAYPGAATHALASQTTHGYRSLCGKERLRWTLEAEPVSCEACKRSLAKEHHPSLTSIQRKIARFIADYNAEAGYPPTVRAIGEHVGLASTSSVHHHLTELVRKHVLTKEPAKPRTLRLVEGS